MDRYQDYFIKDGKFIGKFEEMYQKFDDPWKQKETNSFAYVREAVNVSIKKYNISSMLEIGCGLGKVTNFLKSSNPGLKIEGMDISETAIRKARIAYPDINFFVGNIASMKKLDYDALFFAEIMWCVLKDLDMICENLNKYFKGKIIIVNQVFYKRGIQQYGREYFTSLEEMCNYLPWKCLEKVIEDCIDRDSITTHTVFEMR